MKSNLFVQQKYPFERYDPVIQKSILFRRVTMEKDLEQLHSWMHEKHVIPYWKLNISLEKYKVHLQKFLQDDHQTLLVGELDGVPMSYWESYWVKGDIIGNYYAFDEYDQGIHLLIGPTDFLGKGFTYPLLMTILQKKFQVPETNKIIAEPDIRNEKMIYVFKKCGFQPVMEVELSDKSALLMECERNVFERRWTDWKMKKF
ncbi:MULTISPECIES: GNAT family N-acetyltransferase [Bacillus]|uniref:Lysine N-acyltransferase MbtK n=2 Tax=Bacillus TaxID=1386 RepID=A0A0M4FWH3_9BACI|nr:MULTISPECIES: GNAT family N-acetyltransferase [Bacillus]ALC81263.1 acetyltransferase [Bacillus gobiensis]MBP1080266.1 RimJ/RimL family protein N-acetyltransferase [Bacillus capparidis]MED1094133.1 GNAT family N-acetyltransferase [Bacillus capparidis]